MPVSIAVLTSDIHYNLNTLPLADAALRQAVNKANQLNVPLIIAGDLHDTKANLRGECISAILATVKQAKLKPYVIVGNHDMINERGTSHALEFLDGHVTLVTDYTHIHIDNKRIVILPYQASSETASAYFKQVPRGSIVIAHQGLKSSDAGEYINDKSAIPADCVSHLRIISGHYHTRQSICTAVGPAGLSVSSEAGLWDYIGNPYTLTFGEANDPEKGFQVLMDDASLQFVPTNLRKHIVMELNWDLTVLSQSGTQTHPDDLLWVKVKGPTERLTQLTRACLAQSLGTDSFKLTYEPEEIAPILQASHGLTDRPLLSSLIESAQISQEQKSRISALIESLNE